MSDEKQREEIAERLVRQRAADTVAKPWAEIIIGPRKDDGTTYMSRENAKAIVRIIDTLRADRRAYALRVAEAVRGACLGADDFNGNTADELRDAIWALKLAAVVERVR